MSRERLFELAAKADEQLREFQIDPDDDTQQAGPSTAKMVGTGAGLAGAAGAGYLAYKNKDAIANAGKDAARGGLKKTASAMGQASNSLYKKAKAAGVPIAETPGVQGVVRRGQGAVSGVLARAAKGLRKVATVFTRADADRIVALAARIDAIEFGDPNQQRSKVGVGLMGGPQALYDQKKYKDSGLVYKKRNAYVDNLKGSLAGEGVALGTVGAGVGAATLAAKRKLPKGVLRKGGAAVGQFMKKNPLATIVGASAAGIGAGLATQHHSAESRRKALLKLRLAGGGE